MNTCFNLRDGCKNTATNEFCPECLANGGIHNSKLGNKGVIRKLYMPPWLMALIMLSMYHIIKGIMTIDAIPWTGMFTAWIVIIAYRVWKLEKELRKGL